MFAEAPSGYYGMEGANDWATAPPSHFGPPQPQQQQGPVPPVVVPPTSYGVIHGGIEQHQHIHQQHPPALYSEQPVGSPPGLPSMSTFAGMLPRHPPPSVPPPATMSGGYLHQPESPVEIKPNLAELYNHTHSPGEPGAPQQPPPQHWPMHTQPAGAYSSSEIKSPTDASHIHTMVSILFFVDKTPKEKTGISILSILSTNLHTHVSSHIHLLFPLPLFLNYAFP